MTSRHQRIAHRLAMLLDAVVPAGVEVLPHRFTGTPHLVVEILSTDPARDMVRKAGRYAAAGLRRYWIADPDGPVVIEHGLAGGTLVERARHRPCCSSPPGKRW